MEVDVQRDFFTESSPSALRAIFASWSLEDCKHWCDIPIKVLRLDMLQYMCLTLQCSGYSRIFFAAYCMAARAVRSAAQSPSMTHGSHDAMLWVSGCRLEEDIGLQLAMEEDNKKFFPASNSSREVRDRLVGACTSLGVRIECKTSVEGLLRTPGASQILRFLSCMFE